MLTVPSSWTTAAAIARFAFAGLVSTENGHREPLSVAAIAHREQLRQLICTQFCGHSTAEGAIAAILQGEAAALRRLEVYLQDAMDDNSGFATAIQDLAHCFELARQTSG
jgi:hypothetical protein